MIARNFQFSHWWTALAHLCTGASAMFLLASASHSARAQSIFGLFESPPSAPAVTQPQADSPAASPRQRVAHGHVAFAQRLSLCVRLCDGFAFPVGLYRGSGDREVHESTCHAQCPEAETALYLSPGGADSFADARAAEDGSAYSDLPHAFGYTKTLDRSCRCHAHTHRTLASVLLDHTLRRGDVLMTTHGMKVFEGGASYPYRLSDFGRLATSKDVKKDERGRLTAMEQASLALTEPQEGRAVQEDLK